MTEVWLRAALWLGLAPAATLISIRLRIATALSEIVIGTVAQLLIGVALGLIVAPFTYRTMVFAIATALVIGVLPWVTPRFFRAFGGRPSELEAKYLLLVLFALGGLAAWAESEAVLPAYLVGMVLAGTVGKDHALIRRLRTLTFGFLTPFYFIRAGSFVSVPSLIAAPGAVGGLLLAKLVPSAARPVSAAVAASEPEG